MNPSQADRPTLRGAALALLLLLCLAGCTVREINPRSLNVAELELASDSSELIKAAQAQINLLELAGSTAYQLRMFETIGEDVVALAAKGHVTKRQLWYEMSYRLWQGDEMVHTGSYNFSQVFDNDERNARANLLAKKRFYAKARDDGVDSMLEQIKLWAAN